MQTSAQYAGWQGTLAAARFCTPNAFTTGSGMRSRAPPILKFCRDLCVCAPQYLHSRNDIGYPPWGTAFFHLQTNFICDQASMITPTPYLSAGTSRGPNVSFSVRVAGEEKCATLMAPVAEQSARSCSVPPAENSTSTQMDASPYLQHECGDNNLAACYNPAMMQKAAHAGAL